jgi:4-aminobutyrate aminotransferase-like enzyme
VFSTFGGNPVAAQAALAVLDVIEDERIVAHAKRVGEGLIAALRDLASAEVVGVRGRGLLIGVELTGADVAARVVDELRDGGVLIGRTGKRDNVLKIRPPLVFDDEHAAILVEGLRRAL